MAMRRRWWRVRMGLDGWTVERCVRVRPSKAWPEGYSKWVRAPGSPFRDKAEAERVRAALNWPHLRQSDPAPA